MWSYLSRGNDGLTLVMVAINSLTMLVLYGILGGFLLGVGKLPVPWQALLLSVAVYVALPLVAGFLSRKWIIRAKGEDWFKRKFLHLLTPVTITALLLTLILLFSFKGEVILANPLTILWISVPLFVQTVFIFTLGYVAAKLMKLRYEDAAPAAMIGASNHFEVAIATAVMIFGLQSGAALATVVGVLIEVPVMLMLVSVCRRTSGWFRGGQAQELYPELHRTGPPRGDRGDAGAVDGVLHRPVETAVAAGPYHLVGMGAVEVHREVDAVALGWVDRGPEVPSYGGEHTAS